MNTILQDNPYNTFADLLIDSEKSFQSAQANQISKLLFNLFKPLRQWLDQVEIKDREMARFLSRAIPAQCPFERDIVLFGRKVGHIPPLCKLNPFYEQFVGLRFRALCFLADQCGEDIQSYCSWFTLSRS